MKTCSTCGAEKQLSEFQVRRASKDGLTSSCKACLSTGDKARAMLPDRVAARAAYAKTDAGVAAVKRAKQKYAKENRISINKKSLVESLSPEQLERRRAAKSRYMRSTRGADTQKRTNARTPERRSARIAVGNAVRDGSLSPWSACAIPDCCNHRIEAHHADYSRPLNVVWLCQAHHKQAHALTDLLMRSAS